MPSVASDVECCGLKRMHGFAGPMKVESILGSLLLGYNSADGYAQNNHLVILQEKQKPDYEELLFKAGFKIIYNGLYNPNTRRLLTLYLREGVPERCTGSGQFDESKFEICTLSNSNDKIVRPRTTIIQKAKDALSNL